MLCGHDQRVPVLKRRIESAKNISPERIENIIAFNAADVLLLSLRASAEKKQKLDTEPRL